MRIAVMYATLMPLLLAGAANMLFTKSRLYRAHCEPIDGGRCFTDGKRIFGDNKTWAGFLGMIAATCIAQVLWGLLSASSETIGCANEMYQCFDNTLPFNAAVGALLGFMYVLCELPNSFLKRRLNIQPGKTADGFKGALFFVIDQIDSLLGVVLLLALLTGITLPQYVQYILLGAVTHLALNAVLYALKIRKNL